MEKLVRLKSWKGFLIKTQMNERIESTKSKVKKINSLNGNYMDTCCNWKSIVLLFPLHREIAMWVVSSTKLFEFVRAKTWEEKKFRKSLFENLNLWLQLNQKLIILRINYLITRQTSNVNGGYRLKERTFRLNESGVAGNYSAWHKFFMIFVPETTTGARHHFENETKSRLKR